MNTNKIMIILFGLWMGLAASGANFSILEETGDSLRLRQFNGVEVTLPKKPKTVVIGYSSLIQVWYCAGGTAAAVPEVTSSDTLPEPARQLPTVGTFSTLSAEKIIAMKPGLVLLNGRNGGHNRLRETFASLGIATACFKYENYSDFMDLTDLFCRLNGGELSQCAEAMEIDRRVKALEAKTAKLGNPRFAVVFAAAAGFSLETGNTNTVYMLNRLGGRNIIDADTGRIPFSFEKLIYENPDVIFINTMGRTDALQKRFRNDIMSQPVWRELKAAKAGRVHFLPADLFLYQPGTRFPEAFAQLAGYLFPDAEFTQ